MTKNWKTKILIASIFILSLGMTSTSANIDSFSDYAPEITFIEKYPDQNAVVIRWIAPKKNLGSNPITDYAYRITTPTATSSAWQYMNLSYELIDSEFSLQISGLVRCDLCSANLIELAAVSDGVIQTASKPIQISFDFYTPELLINSATPLSGGFLFKIQEPEGVLKFSGKQSNGEPYISNDFESTYFGPYLYKVTAIYGPKKVKVSFNPNDQSFLVTGVQPGQRLGITIARKPTTCNVYPYAYCAAIRSKTIWAVAGQQNEIYSNNFVEQLQLFEQKITASRSRASTTTGSFFGHIK